MKTILALALIGLSSCVSTVTTTTAPDGTITVVEQRGIDPLSVAAATEITRTISATK